MKTISRYCLCTFVVLWFSGLIWSRLIGFNKVPGPIETAFMAAMFISFFVFLGYSLWCGIDKAFDDDNSAERR